MPRLVGRWERQRTPHVPKNASVGISTESAHSCLEFMDSMADKIRRKGFAAFLSTAESDLRPVRKAKKSHHRK